MDSSMVVLGWIASAFAVIHLEHARQDKILRPFDVLVALGAGLILSRNQDQLTGPTGNWEWASLALLIGALSPWLGWLIWARENTFRNLLALILRLIAGFLLAGLAWGLLLRPDPESWFFLFLLAALSAILTVLPFRRLHRAMRSFHFWLQARSKKRQTRREAKALRQREAALEAAQANPAPAVDEHLRQELEAQRHELEALRSGLDERTTRQQQTRAAIRQRVLALREAERAQLETAGTNPAPLHFDPDLGFLIAEAWRQLEWEIVTGERIPAVANEAFFFQVVDSFLRANDFEERFLHAAGTSAMAAVNAYLVGAHPLLTARKAVTKLHLERHQLASAPLEQSAGQPLAESLLEAWLLPHRRWQRLCWEQFSIEGNEVLVTRFGAPRLHSFEGWQQSWDEQPRVFLEAQRRTDYAPPPL